MGRPIEIKLDAETTAAERGLSSTADALDDVSDALDDVDKATRDADRGLDDVADAARDAERGLKDARDGADDTARVLDRDLTKALDRTADASRDAARDIKESFEENAITSEDVFGAALKAEIVSNAAESGAEIARGLKDGFDSEDVETIVDGISDTIVAVGTLGGPIGTAGGLAAASAMNLIVGPAIEEAKARAQEFQETFTDAFQNIATAGADMGRELAITSIAGEFAQDTQKMADATKVANSLGVERGAVLRAMAGDQKALTEVTEAHNRATEEAVAVWDREAQQIQDLGLATEETAAKAEDWRDKARGLGDAIGNVNSAYENNTDALNAATEAASAKAEVDAIANQRITDQAVALANSTGAAQRFEVTIDGATRTLEAMPGGKVIDVTDGGSAELTQQQINAIHGKTVTIEAVMGDIQAVVDQAFRYLRPPVVTPTIGPFRQRMV
ncbi:hypothetical protein [Cellulosimicrobium cellulans]|uniref:hypothetical protein n=1 Tax=Cellulosimicrobium cellulans TaxID=1710 RepID=UPI0024062DC2|nr:hypothetical protein [Cellulosimicrobium cellulans]MDF9876171.1 chromosome segregation ATPase [Cellulosimicrobium cellulans]